MTAATEPPERGRLDPMEVVSTVSHELRSPLTSIKGYTSLLLSRWARLDDDQKRLMLEQVNLDADRVTRLVNELLDISRLHAGRLHLRRQAVTLPAVADAVVERVRLVYPDLQVERIFPPDLPSVSADPDKVTQVLTNLVENACKYASPVGVRIEGSLQGPLVAIAVHDRGPGIPVDELDRLFDRFFQRQDDPSVRPEHGRPTGTGLGLWISRGLVEAHGGTLTVASAPGRGATFTMTLPIEEATSETDLAGS